MAIAKVDPAVKTFAGLACVPPLLNWLSKFFFSDSLQVTFNHWPAMVFLTAICVLALAGSLVLQASAPRRSSQCIAALFAVALCLFVFFEFYFPIFLWGAGVTSTAMDRPPAPYLMSPQSCFAFFMLASSHLLRSSKSFSSAPILRSVFQVMNSVVLTFCAIVALGYLYSAIHLYGLSNYVGMSILTAFSAACLAAGSLALDKEFCVVRLFRQKNSAGLFLRNFLGFAVFAPFLVAGLIRWAEVKHGFDNSYGMAAFVFFTVAVILGIGIKAAFYLEKIDVQNASLRKKDLEAAEANEARRLRERFVGNMSHEVRTPLTAILGYLDVLDQSSEGEASRAVYMVQAKRNARTLLRVLDDILDLSKLSSDQIKIWTRPFVVRELVEDVISQFLLEADKKGIVIKLVAAPDSTIIADANRVQQILTNLVSNAVKFTAKGRIEILARLEPATLGPHPNLTVEVSDTGLGIPEAAHASIFKNFFQVDDSITRKYGGSGIGLALSAKLAELMQGRLELVWSVPEVGSGFRLMLPVRVETNPKVGVDAQTRPASPAGFLTDRRILLVDDNPDNQFLISRFLKQAGASVDTAENGAIGVEKARSAAYALILMDIQMPVMSGLEATRTLRDSGYLGPIIALSAHASPEHEQRSLEAGCDAHAVKPIVKNDLFAKIGAAMASR